MNQVFKRILDERWRNVYLVIILGIFLNWCCLLINIDEISEEFEGMHSLWIII